VINLHVEADKLLELLKLRAKERITESSNYFNTLITQGESDITKQTILSNTLLDKVGKDSTISGALKIILKKALETNNLQNTSLTFKALEVIMAQVLQNCQGRPIKPLKAIIKSWHEVLKHQYQITDLKKVQQNTIFDLCKSLVLINTLSKPDLKTGLENTKDVHFTLNNLRDLLLHPETLSPKALQQALTDIGVFNLNNKELFKNLFEAIPEVQAGAPRSAKTFVDTLITLQKQIPADHFLNLTQCLIGIFNTDIAHKLEKKIKRAIQTMLADNLAGNGEIDTIWNQLCSKHDKLYGELGADYLWVIDPHRALELIKNYVQLSSIVNMIIIKEEQQLVYSLAKEKEKAGVTDTPEGVNCDDPRFAGPGDGAGPSGTRISGNSSCPVHSTEEDLAAFADFLSKLSGGSS